MVDHADDRALPPREGLWAPTLSAAEVVAVLGTGEYLWGSDDEWQRRRFEGMPGMVYTLQSDNCGTGRPAAPENVAYDMYGAELVFRQPRDERDLASLQDAAEQEVFGAYRFDGLERLTEPALDQWCASTDTLKAWLHHQLSATDPELAESAEDYLRYLESDDCTDYLLRLRSHLQSADG